MNPANATLSAKSSPGFPSDIYRVVEDVLSPADVHQAARTSEITSTTALFLVFSLMLMVAHAVIFYLWIFSDTLPIIPLFLHVIVCASTGLVAYRQYRKGMDAHHLTLLALLTATTGIFGAIGAFLGFFITQIFSARSQDFDEWYESIFPTDHQTESQTIYDQIVEGIDENPSLYGVMPFADIMRLGSEQQKRRALAKMTSRFSPRFAPAFRMALVDASNTIRVQAATAVAKVEKEFTAKLERIELARTKDPNNPLLTLALARFYDDYAFTGVLDAELERINRDRAVNSYKHYLQHDPEAAEIWLAIGRLLYRNKQWYEASEWFRQALDRGWRSDTLVLWYFECLFRLGQYRELRRLVIEYGRDVLRQESLPTDVREAVTLWLQVG